MHDGKTFLYVARNLTPARYNPDYVKANKETFDELYTLNPEDEHEWCVTVYKGKEYVEYGYAISVLNIGQEEPIQQNLIIPDLPTLIEHINIPRKMFEPTRRSVLKYVGAASENEARKIITKWLQTTS